MPTYEYQKITKRLDGRLSCRINKKNEYLSRVLYCNCHNVTLESIKGFHIHHIDENIANNKKDNLLKVTPSDHYSIYHSNNGSGKRSDSFKKHRSEIMKAVWEGGFKRKRRQTKYVKYIDKILKMNHDGYSQTRIGKELSIPRTSIQNILKILGV